MGEAVRFMIEPFTWKQIEPWGAGKTFQGHSLFGVEQRHEQEEKAAEPMGQLRLIPKLRQMSKASQELCTLAPVGIYLRHQKQPLVGDTPKYKEPGNTMLYVCDTCILWNPLRSRDITLSMH